MASVWAEIHPKLEARGKPSTWLPRKRLVEQIQANKWVKLMNPEAEIQNPEPEIQEPEPEKSGIRNWESKLEIMMIIWNFISVFISLK